MNINYFEACSGIGMQRFGLENALNTIGESVCDSQGILEVNPKALVGYAVLHNEKKLLELLPSVYEKDPKEIAEYLTNIGVGQFEGTPSRPKKIDWFKKKSGKALKYMQLVYASCIVSNNRGDMNKLEKLPNGLDIFFSSSPCQSVSSCGLQAGMKKGSGTRSSLAFDVSRLVDATEDKPKVIIFENVKGMVNKKNIADFTMLENEIRSLGYNTYWKVLNAKWCGVPQNRERVFFVSIRKDIDNGQFAFPIEFDRGIRLKDILQKHVDLKYYISNDKVKRLIEDIKSKNKMSDLTDAQNTVNVKRLGTEYGKTSESATTLCARDYKGLHEIDRIPKNEQRFIGSIYGMHSGYAGAVWDKNGISNALKCHNGGNSEPLIIDNDVVKIGSLHTVNGSWSDPQIDRVYGTYGICPTLNTMQGGRRQPMIATNDLAIPVLTPERLNKRQNGRRFKENGDPAFTLTAVDRHGVMTEADGNHSVYCEAEGCDITVRRLTPEECFVLMGLTMDDCKKCREYGLTDTDLYTIAGNGLVTNCVQYICEHLYKALRWSDYITTDEKMQSLPIAARKK